MTIVRLAAVLTVVELADLVTYLQAPHFEANPFIVDFVPAEVAAAKLALIAITWGLVALAPEWRPRTRTAFEFVLIAGVAWASFAVGTNVATLSMLASTVPRGTVL